MARPDCYQSSTLGSTERSFASDSYPGKQQQLVSSIGVVEEENTLGSVRGQRRPVSLQIHNQHHQRASSSALSRTIQENDYDSIPARYLSFAMYPLNAGSGCCWGGDILLFVPLPQLCCVLGICNIGANIELI